MHYIEGFTSDRQFLWQRCIILIFSKKESGTAQQRKVDGKGQL